jgi:hypothetical protein
LYELFIAAASASAAGVVVVVVVVVVYVITGPIRSNTISRVLVFT